MKAALVFLILIVSTHFPFSLSAQFKNITIDEQSDDVRVQPSIAINPRNPLNIVVATASRNIFYTIDGGKKWEKVQMSSQFGSYGHPVLLVDHKGTFYCIHSADPTGEGLKNERGLEAIVCQVSDDGGKTWDGGNEIGLNSSKDQSNPWADINSKGEIVVAWTQFDKVGSSDPGCKSNILLSTSSNGRKWSKPIEISSTQGDCRGGSSTNANPFPAFADDKKLYVTWSRDGKVFLDRSFDDGFMWLSDDIEIASRTAKTAQGSATPPSDNPTAILKMDRTKTAQKGLLYLAFEQTAKGRGDQDITLIRSARFGDFWTSPISLGDSDHTNQVGPAMCVDQTTGIVYVLFYNYKNGEQVDVILAFSTDNGNSFKTTKVSESSFVQDETFGGAFTGIAAHKGLIAATWTRKDGAKISIVTAAIKQDELPK